jgi:hypothetical protein
LLILLRYYRMKCMILLGGNLRNWRQAYRCFVDAEVIWRITNQWHSDDKDPGIIAALEEIHEGLEELRYVRNQYCNLNLR